MTKQFQLERELESQQRCKMQLNASSYLIPRYTQTIQVNTTYSAAVRGRISHTYIGNQYIRKNQNQNRNISALWPICVTKPCAISYWHIKLPSCKQL